ncbi:MAG: histidine phosphotransferase family protein [Hasllibacter sp.]
MNVVQPDMEGEAALSSGPDLAALAASRICHDLVSPLGAIGNGVELMEMTGAAGGPELGLIKESVADATARIRFFRIAFGAAQAGQHVGEEEWRPALEARARGSRMKVDWGPSGTLPRAEAKLSFLALACLESACAYGGTAGVGRGARGAWSLSLRAERLRFDETCWALLEGAPVPADLPPAAVQFALLPEAARAAGRNLRIERGVARAEIRF